MVVNTISPLAKLSMPPIRHSKPMKSLLAGAVKSCSVWNKYTVLPPFLPLEKSVYGVSAPYTLFFVTQSLRSKKIEIAHLFLSQFTSTPRHAGACCCISFLLLGNKLG